MSLNSNGMNSLRFYQKQKNSNIYILPKHYILGTYGQKYKAR